MALIAAFMLNASLNFAIALVIAKALGPEEFGRYALATSIVAILSTLLFEGLRFATVRFYSDRTRSDEPAIRATLEIGHAFLSLVLLSLAGTMLLFGVELGGLSSWSLAAVLGAVLGQSLFEYHGALARARFQRWVYVRLIVVKNIAALCLMMGGAFYFHDANVVLIGLAVSALSGVAAVRCSLGDPETRLRLARPTLLRDFFVYAIPLIAANAIYTLTYFMNRSWLASHNGLAEVGQPVLSRLGPVPSRLHHFRISPGHPPVPACGSSCRGQGSGRRASSTREQCDPHHCPDPAVDGRVLGGSSGH
jgi:O-antigen/teichoic acid export membrane protein